MTLSYGQYTITGTVDEIKEFIMKMTPTTVDNTTIAIMKESDDGSLPTLNIVKCSCCGSRNVIAYNVSGNSSNGVTDIKTYYKCNDCGKFFEIEV